MAKEPAEVQEEFLKAFNAADIDALMTLYEQDAAFVPEPGKLLVGVDNVRAALSGFLSLKGTLERTKHTVVPSGDLALLHGEWVLRHAGEDGKPAEMVMRTSEVVRRQADGSWLYVIDNPFTPE
jgi:uncharacterized protein (TIGR02246 family)